MYSRKEIENKQSLVSSLQRLKKTGTTKISLCWKLPMDYTVCFRDKFMFWLKIGLFKVCYEGFEVLIDISVMNFDRSLPYRVQATARWTIIPTVTYHDS